MHRFSLNSAVWCCAIGVVATAASAVLQPASAAVRQCMAPITSDVVPAQSEIAGKRAALESWGSKTRKKHGEAFVSWRLANKRVLSCVPGRDTSTPLTCVAYASPCRIDQVPGRQAPKRKRILPGGGIEI